MYLIFYIFAVFLVGWMVGFILFFLFLFFSFIYLFFVLVRYKIMFPKQFVFKDRSPTLLLRSFAKTVTIFGHSKNIKEYMWVANQKSWNEHI